MNPSVIIMVLMVLSCLVAACLREWREKRNTERRADAIMRKVLEDEKQYIAGTLTFEPTAPRSMRVSASLHDGLVTIWAETEKEAVDAMTTFANSTWRSPR